jgi:hypothetical protein
MILIFCEINHMNKQEVVVNYRIPLKSMGLEMLNFRIRGLTDCRLNVY